MPGVVLPPGLGEWGVTVASALSKPGAGVAAAADVAPLKRVSPRLPAQRGRRVPQVPRKHEAARGPLPLLPELEPLFPAGALMPGSVVTIETGRASAATALLLMLAASSSSGLWCAVVGEPAFGALAATEVGVRLDRLALVPQPSERWQSVVATLLDGCAVVALATRGRVSAAAASRFAARARQRGSVLLCSGAAGSFPGSQLTIAVESDEWQGVQAGRGRLRARSMVLTSGGRGAASRRRSVRVRLPGSDS